MQGLDLLREEEKNTGTLLEQWYASSAWNLIIFQLERKNSCPFLHYGLHHQALVDFLLREKASFVSISDSTAPSLSALQQALHAARTMCRTTRSRAMDWRGGTALFHEVGFGCSHFMFVVRLVTGTGKICSHLVKHKVIMAIGQCKSWLVNGWSQGDVPCTCDTHTPIGWLKIIYERAFWCPNTAKGSS
jgi:hypothetical protein